MDISKIDRNFKIETNVGEADTVFLNVRETPFDLYGLYDPVHQKDFKRMPDEVAKSVNDGVASLYLNTAGGRVRFCTDSRYVILEAMMPAINHMPHMPLSGSSGFDLFLEDPLLGGSVFVKGFLPAVGAKDGVEGKIDFGLRKMRYFTLNFPTYNPVKDLWIGLQEDARVDHGQKYLDVPPVVYYGSSITQGGCSMRPGNAYQAIVSRRLNLDFVNLGFSGSGRGEETMIDYLAGLDMSAFVSDYDHNAPNPEHLEATHRRLYERIRAAHPEIPYIMLSRPDFGYGGFDSARRRKVITDTYHFAIANGDSNVYLIDGESLFRGHDHELCTVDGCHPTDVGFSLMADAVEHELRMAFIAKYR